MTLDVDTTKPSTKANVYFDELVGIDPESSSITYYVYIEGIAIEDKPTANITNIPCHSRWKYLRDPRLPRQVDVRVHTACEGAGVLIKGDNVQLFEWTGSSTTQKEYMQDVEQQIDALFDEAVYQDFEDGMESQFSRGLISLVRKHGDLAMYEIDSLITYNRTNPEISSEALRWLGRMKDPNTHGSRLRLLEKSLNSESAWVRDGAALGLASMGDPLAITYIKQAIKRETCAELRDDMEKILKYLEANWHASLGKDGPQT